MAAEPSQYGATDVFTPTTPARATFVERSRVNEKLVDAIRTPGKQVVVYGHSGSGKTTLLVNKLDQLYEDHITTRCTSIMTFESILLNAFDQLAPFIATESVSRGGKQFNAQISAEYSLIKAQLGWTGSSETHVKQVRALPPQLTPQSLARFLGEAKCCWVLEDFHKIGSEHKVHLSQVMKLFMDMADSYRELKIIAVGAVDTARQVIDYDMEMRNRVAEVYVPLMSDDEIDKIVDIGERLLNFRMLTDVKAGIVSFSNGLASACHQLCLNICSSAGIEVTLSTVITITQQQLETALEMYVEYASDTLKASFDRALRQMRRRRYDNCRLILQALSELDHEGAVHAELLEKIRVQHPDYPAGNLTQYLKELQSPDRGGLIRKDAISGRFSFADPIYRIFAQAFFHKSKSMPSHGNIVLNESALRELMEAMRRAFESGARKRNGNGAHPNPA